MGPWLADAGFVDKKCDEQRAAAEQQGHHRARLEPVEAIALIKTGIDHRDGSSRAKKRRADQAVRPWSGGYRSWPEMHPARGSLHPSDVLATMPQTVFSGQRQRSLIRHTSQRGLRARQV